MKKNYSWFIILLWGDSQVVYLVFKLLSYGANKVKLTKEWDEIFMWMKAS